MKKIPETINSVKRKCSIFIDSNDKRNIGYTINEGEDTETIIHVELPRYYRPRKSSKIVDENSNFVNGFKVVKTSNGEYAYVRESDNCLLPFRYDVAFDFNEFGYAIVGKDGSVSWINKDFKYLNLQGEMVEEKLDKSWAEFEGWQGVTAFSKGDIPLSRVYDGRNKYGKIAYFGTDGKFKEFYQYDGKIKTHLPRVTFSSGTTFNEKGLARAEGDILFAKGYSVSCEDLIKICTGKCYIDCISEDAEKCYDEEMGKAFRRK